MRKTSMNGRASGTRKSVAEIVRSHLVAVVSLAALSAVAPLSIAAPGDMVHASVETIRVVESPPVADVMLRVSVKNEGSATASNVVVVFPSGLESRIGNVAPGATAVGGVETHTFNYAKTPTRHLPVAVTVRFTLNGQPVQTSQNVIVNR